MSIDKLDHNIYARFNAVIKKLDHLQEQIMNLENDIAQSMDILKTQLIRIKNGEEVSSNAIINSLGYQDLSPEQAYKLYNSKNFDFILIDVSHKDFLPQKEFLEAKKIPLEEISIRHKEIISRSIPIFLISEDGTRSILACELLNRFGHYNLSNISGGYKYWPKENSISLLEEFDSQESA